MKSDMFHPQLDPDFPAELLTHKSESTYADECMGDGSQLLGPLQKPPEFIAQVDSSADVDWVCELRARAHLEELKYKYQTQWLPHVDRRLDQAMRDAWLRTDIVISDPQPAIERALQLRHGRG